MSMLMLGRQLLVHHGRRLPSSITRSSEQTTLRSFRTRTAQGTSGLGINTRMTLKERLMQPTSGLPFAIGRGFVIGASGLGIGALAFYGAGFGSQAGAIDRSMGWNHLVRERIQATYQYFGLGLASTAATAAMVFRSPTMMNLVARGSIPAMLVSMALVMGSSVLLHSIEYQEGFGAKQMAFLGHTALIGTMIAPMAMLGGQLILRAAIYTAGVVGGLSTVAACAPSDKFLYMGAPLSMGLGVVFAANIGSLFLSPQTAVGAGLASIVVYGGLVLFSGFLLYDTQKIIHRAETHPSYGRPFDPVNSATSIYMDTINIFIRIAMILAGNNRKK